MLFLIRGTDVLLLAYPLDPLLPVAYKPLCPEGWSYRYMYTHTSKRHLQPHQIVSAPRSLNDAHSYNMHIARPVARDGRWIPQVLPWGAVAALGHEGGSQRQCTSTWGATGSPLPRPQEELGGDPTGGAEASRLRAPFFGSSCRCA